ncbi:MAG: hypothetical protein ABF570_03075, partial [Acetobacter syzygii]
PPPPPPPPPPRPPPPPPPAPPPPPPCVVVLLFMTGQWLLQPEDMAAIEANGRLTPYIRAATTYIHPYLAEFDAKGVAPNRPTGHDATL